jgi:hypothetical protein
LSPEGDSTAGPPCPRCGGTDRFGPAPLRTSAHPNSSLLLVEAPGARHHDLAVQGTVCLGCGDIDLVLPGPSLERLREAAGGGVAPRRRRSP